MQDPDRAFINRLRIRVPAFGWGVLHCAADLPRATGMRSRCRYRSGLYADSCVRGLFSIRLKGYSPPQVTFIGHQLDLRVIQDTVVRVVEDTVRGCSTLRRRLTGRCWRLRPLPLQVTSQLEGCWLYSMVVSRTVYVKSNDSYSVHELRVVQYWI